MFGLLILFTYSKIKKIKVKVGTKCYPVIKKDLKEPETNAVSTCTKNHVVQSGQEALGIATLYSTTVSRLQELNPGVNLNSLSLNMILIVPIPCPVTIDNNLYTDNPKFKDPVFAINGSALLCLCFMGSITSPSYCESQYKSLLYFNYADKYGKILKWGQADYYYDIRKLSDSEKSLKDFEMRVEGYDYNGKRIYIVRDWKNQVFDPSRTGIRFENPVEKIVFDTWP